MVESPAREQQKAKVQMWEDIIETLSKQLTERLRMRFSAKARNPGDSNDPGTLAFQDRMRSEAEGLKS